MPRLKGLHSQALAVALLVVTFLLAPLRAAADGAPIPSDPALWAALTETMQVAVVNLQPGDTAHVDLFISLLDTSGESHQLVFLLPLGIAPADFSVTEKTSTEFEAKLTRGLDTRLRTQLVEEADYRRRVLLSLLAGEMVINGGWSWPLWVILALSACGASEAGGPVATYETPSSQISIYDIDENTNLEALIVDTGLNPAVRDTLVRLQGQQVAVVNLQTQPPPTAGQVRSSEPSQPGIHLAWQSGLVPGAGGPAYSYPLGTGSAWARPIEQTRVYVVTPPGMDFTVQYPRLGLDLSGFTYHSRYNRYEPRIQTASTLAFAADNAVGDFGRVWRATYVQSNPAEDIVITPVAGLTAETQAAYKRIEQNARISRFTWLGSVAVALALWAVAWRYVMPLMLKVTYRWRDRRFWLDAAKWSLLYPLTNLVPAAIIALLLLIGNSTLENALPDGARVVLLISGLIAALVSVVALSLTLWGPVSLALFIRDRTQALGVSKARAFGAYAVVVIIANIAYLLAALGYAVLVKAW